MNLPDKKSQTATPEPMAQRFSNKPSVLVVDDEHMVRIMVQLGLERDGFKVLLAAREATDLFRAAECRNRFQEGPRRGPRWQGNSPRECALVG